MQNGMESVHSKYFDFPLASRTGRNVGRACKSLFKKVKSKAAAWRRRRADKSARDGPASPLTPPYTKEEPVRKSLLTTACYVTAPPRAPRMPLTRRQVASLPCSFLPAPAALVPHLSHNTRRPSNAVAHLPCMSTRADSGQGLTRKSTFAE